MSAGDDAVHAVEGLGSVTKVISGLQYLAPKFEAAVVAAIAECDALGLDAVVYETYRTFALAQEYYKKGRTVIPPETPVTNARDNMHSFHGFCMAVDVIHKTKRWSVPEAWFVGVAAVFKKHGCAWGGDWHSFRDLPHFQHGTLVGAHAAPDDEDRKLIRNGGLIAVWQRHGAL